MKELIRYPEDSNGNRVGCFYAYAAAEYGRTVIIGWSAYNWEDEDRCFSKPLARAIAKGRAIKGETQGRMPDALKMHLTDFLFHVNAVFQPERTIIVNDDRPRIDKDGFHTSPPERTDKGRLGCGRVNQ
jgi:hypothetical protein